MGRLSAALLTIISVLLVGAGIIVALPVAGEKRVDLSGTPTRVAPSWEPVDGPLGLTEAAVVDPSPGEANASPSEPASVDVEPSASEGPGAASGASDGSSAPEPRPAQPTALAIPSLDVVSQVVATGVTAQQEMEIPPVDQAGWYRHGPRPGDPAGSAVVAAHVDYEGEPGVFQRLGELALGETVLMSDADGRWREFRVTERFQLDKSDLAAADLFRSSGQHVLTLVTCGGAFDESMRNYEDKGVAAFSLERRAPDLKAFTATIFTDEFKKQAEGAAFEMGVLSIGMTLETRAIAYFSRAAEETSEAEVRDFYNFLADWERGHLDALQSIHTSVREDFWSEGRFSPF